MKTAYVLHGVCDEEEYFRMEFPAPSNAHWLPWLQQKFLRSGVLCQCLEMPKPYAPTYEEWCGVWERQELAADTVVVAHSAGGGFILKWLGEHPEARLGKLVLVAPWRDPERQDGAFLEAELDAGIVGRVGSMHLVVSDNDTADVMASCCEIEAFYPEAEVHRFAGKGHFCWGDLGGGVFPELWEICKC